MDLNGLAAALIAARARKAECEEAVKAAGREVSEAEAALFSALVESELENITADGYTFAIDPKTYWSVIPECGDALHAVMEGLGRGSIFRYTVHHQTLQATLRELAEQCDGELPEEVAALVTPYDKGKVSVRKAPATK